MAKMSALFFPPKSRKNNYKNLYIMLQYQYNRLLEKPLTSPNNLGGPQVGNRGLGWGDKVGENRKKVSKIYTGITVVVTNRATPVSVLKKKKEKKNFRYASVSLSGFRRGRGCTDQFFIVRQICEKYIFRKA